MWHGYLRLQIPAPYSDVYFEHLFRSLDGKCSVLLQWLPDCTASVTTCGEIRWLWGRDAVKPAPPRSPSTGAEATNL